MKKGFLIGIVIAGGIALIGGGVYGLIMLIMANNKPFAQEKHFEPKLNDTVTSMCIFEASTEDQNFYERKGVVVNTYPMDKNWNHADKIELSGKYTEDGYPVYKYSWNGRYQGAEVKYYCAIRTYDNYADILWINQLSSRIVEKQKVQLYDKDGNEVDSDNL